MLTAAGKKLVFIVWSKEMFLPYSLSVLSSPHNCFTSGFWNEHKMQGPSCVNTFLRKYRIALRIRIFNSLLWHMALAHGCAAAAACGAFSDVFNLSAWFGSSTPSSWHLAVVLTARWDRTHHALHLTFSRQIAGSALKRIWLWSTRSPCTAWD